MNRRRNLSRLMRSGLPGPALAAGLLAAAFAVPGAGAQDSGIDGDAVVARIGAEEVMLSEIVGTMYALPEERRAAEPFEALYEEVLQRRIDQSLVFNAAVAAGLRDAAAHARAMANAERRMLTDAYLKREIAARVSDSAAQARYDEIRAGAADKTELRARRIRTADQAEARALHARIAAGEDFAAVAAELDFPGADSGGDLGYFSEATMLPAIVTAARALPVGGVSAPFPTQYGWHLLKLEEIRPVPVPAFDELRESIYRGLTEETIEAVLVELRAANPVERFNRDGSPLDETPR